MAAVVAKRSWTAKQQQQQQARKKTPLLRTSSLENRLDDLLSIIRRDFQSGSSVANTLLGANGLDNKVAVKQELSFDELFYASSGEELEHKLFGPNGLTLGNLPTAPSSTFSEPSAGSLSLPLHKRCEGESIVKTEPVSPALPTVSSTTSSFDEMTAASAPSTSTESLDIYRDLILRHLVQDIRATSAKLNISYDPYSWTAEESALWLNEMVGQFRLSELPSRLYYVGQILCAMGQEDFVAYAPHAGETLHAQLQIWKTAADYLKNEQQQPQLQQSEVQWPCNSGTPLEEQQRELTLNDWLAGFDPSNVAGAAGWPAAADSSAAEPTTGSSYLGCRPASSDEVSTTTSTFGGISDYHRQVSNEAMADRIARRYLPSPLGSDSGISADYDESIGAGLKLRRHTTGSTGGNIHLWQFIRELLDKPEMFSSCVRWLDRKDGVFKIENSHQLARLWGQRKNRCKMNYDKLSRSLRQYYKKGIIRKTGQRQRLIYQFIPPYHFA